jgi:hypothetical protein
MTWTIALVAGLLVAGVLPSLPEAAEEHAYIGAGKCKMCHNSAAKGAQYTKWAESAHSKAYETLASEEAKKIAAEKGLGDPQQACECLSCHVTGHGAPAESLTGKYAVEEGVSCESCHGPGGDYWKMTIMKDRDQAVANGMVVPTEETCKACHNEKSPTFKGFDWATFFPKVEHDNPNT